MNLVEMYSPSMVVIGISVLLDRIPIVNLGEIVRDVVELTAAVIRLGVNIHPPVTELIRAY